MPEPFPYIYADAGRLQQVLRNLLSNALRFTPIDGHVTITAGVEGEVGTGDQAGRNVVLRVTDTGCGIAPEDQERIFERFFQVANKDNGHSGGQGLGLAIVKMIVELHGGVVFVQSMPGEGSTFTCILPVLLPDSAEV
jgi:signal transduction histidine kinase